MPEASASRPYLAFDFGAESGRAVLAHLHGGILTTEEVHRFPNEPVEYGGSRHWDVMRLWLEVQRTLAKLDSVPLASMGVDAWGVDYALLGDRGELLQNPYHYRDSRTQGVMEQVFARVPRGEIYGITGIQFMPINTLYQLFAAQQQTHGILAAARTLLTIPDLFHYWLTGKAVCEFTNATTSQMVDAASRGWAKDLLRRLGLPADLPAPMVEPGTVVGALLQHSAAPRLAGTPVIAPATHDTGSAVAAIAARNGIAFLSSGTWSMVGTELDAPVLTAEALRYNFTNEGGVAGTTRLLKNVMGLWMLQCCRRKWAAQCLQYDYRELMELAAKQTPFKHLVDPDDASFLNPPDMLAAIDTCCARTQQPAPQSPGAYVRAIFESLALKYRLVIENLERVSGQTITQIRIIGGGSKNRLLNQFTADATGRRVLAGPAEATALGNIAMQILATGEAGSLAEVRAIVDRSFPTEIFEPLRTDEWHAPYQRLYS